MNEDEKRIASLLAYMFYKCIPENDFITLCLNLEKEHNTEIVALEIKAIANTTETFIYTGFAVGEVDPLKKWMNFVDKKQLPDDVADIYRLAQQTIEQKTGELK